MTEEKKCNCDLLGALTKQLKDAFESKTAEEALAAQKKKVLGIIEAWFKEDLDENFEGSHEKERLMLRIEKEI